MAVSGPCRPFRARRGPGGYLGFRRSGSTLGYIPAALSGLVGDRALPRVPPFRLHPRLYSCRRFAAPERPDLFHGPGRPSRYE